MLRDNEYLLDILTSAKRIKLYVSGMTRDAWIDDDQCQDAVVRRLEIIGEAARRVSDETKEFFDLPWRAMTGMRNLMIHEYDDVDLLQVWDTVQADIPKLINVLEKVVPPQ